MIDTHCHIDLYPNPLEILKHCVENKVTVLSMTNLPSHFEKGLPHIQPYKNIRLSLGLHPLYAERHEQEFPLFKRNLIKTSYVGEVGLDFSKDHIITKNVQLKFFTKVLEEIKGKKKIINLHSRKAEKEVFTLLLEYNIQSAIFHWYTGPLLLINNIANSGYFFSINQAMLNSEGGRKIIQKIPKENILTETDGPFITHHGRIIKPSDIRDVHIGLAKIWNISETQVSQIILNNFKKIISTLTI